MEYDAAAKRKELLTCAADLKIMMLNERGHGKKGYILYDSTRVKFQKMQTHLWQQKAVQWLLGNGGSREWWEGGSAKGQEDP